MAGISDERREAVHEAVAEALGEAYDCQRRARPDPADGVVEPPPIVVFECELRIEP